MDSNEDDEEPQDEPGTSSNSQPIVLVLPLHQGPAAIDNSADEDSEYSDEYSARSEASGRTDVYVLTDDVDWTVTPETHNYAAAARSFCIVTTENGDQQELCHLITMP